MKKNNKKIDDSSFADLCNFFIDTTNGIKLFPRKFVSRFFIIIHKFHEHRITKNENVDWINWYMNGGVVSAPLCLRFYFSISVVLNENP